MKYLKSINEAYLGPERVKEALSAFINWDLIDDAKDLSLEYIDDGYTLYISVGYESDTALYRISHAHDWAMPHDDKERGGSWWSGCNFNSIEDGINPDKIFYTFIPYLNNVGIDSTSNYFIQNLAETLIAMYPEYHVKVEGAFFRLISNNFVGNSPGSIFGSTKRINESSSFKESDIKECFLELEDYGFTVDCVFDLVNYILININKRTKGTSWDDFKISEISEVILFAIPYIESEYDLKLKNISIYERMSDRRPDLNWTKIRIEELNYKNNITIQSFNIKFDFPKF